MRFVLDTAPTFTPSRGNDRSTRGVRESCVNRVTVIGAKTAHIARAAVLPRNSCSVRGHTVKKVRSEEGLNAELRQLTQQTRQLREELQEMIRPPTRDRVRGLVQPGWPKPPPESASERRKRTRNS